MSFTSYAQNFEDVILWRALHEVDRGHYIDIGAQDPELDSVSLAFYKAGWRGIHVEPTPFYATRLRETRPDERVIEAVVTDAVGPFPFFEIAQTGISTGRRDIAEHHSKTGYEPRQILAATVRLDELFEVAEGEIHWMKIDVEGMEADVLRSWGESPARPWVIVLESTFPNTQEQTVHLWIDEVLGRGYRQVLFDGLSTYFVHEQHRDLACRFDAPANIFDRFSITSQHFSAGGLRSDLEASQRAVSEERTRAEEIAGELKKASQARDAALLEHKQTLDALSAAHQEHSRTLETLNSAHQEQKQALAALNAAQAEHKQTRDALNAAQQERRTALEALSVAHEEHRAREARLISEVEDARGAREATEQELKTALCQVIAAEQNHRAMLASQSRERQLLEEKHGGKLGELAECLRQAEASAAAANAHVARLEERCGGLQVRLNDAIEKARATSDRLGASERAQTELRSKVEQLETSIRSSEQTNANLRSEIELLHGLLTHADALISRARAEPRDRWHRLGDRLGLAGRSPAIEALAGWSSQPRRGAAKPPAPNQSRTSNEAITTETSSIMQLPAVPGSQNPYLRADSLAEILSWHDVDFVRCAFVTILGRQPEPEGEAFYVDRIRNGHSKMEVLWQLRRSSEGRRHDPGIAGLDRALKRAALGRISLLGYLIRPFTHTEADDRASRRWRSLANSIDYLRVTQIRQFASLSAKVENAASAMQAATAEQVTRVRPAGPLSNRARDVFAAMVNVR